LTQTIIPFGETIDIRAAEDAISKFSAESVSTRSVAFDFSKCRNVDIGGGYRIGNLFRRLAQHGAVTVLLPEGSYLGSTISSQFFLAFTRSGLGPALARYANTIMVGSLDVTEGLKHYYSESLTVPGQNSIYVDGLHTGAIDVDDEPSFGRLLSSLLSKVNLRVASIRKDSLTEVVALCFEAVQNVSDHAARKPLPAGASIFSYLALRYYKGTASSSQGAFSGYLKRLIRGHYEGKEPYWLEIVVNDDGNGIAARQTLDEDIFWKRLEEEEQALVHALTKGSVKLQARDAKIRGGLVGEGYPRIRTALRELKAFASLRSGRCFASFDGTVTHEDKFRLNRGEYGLPLGVMPGTTLQIVIPLPIDTDKQGRLDLV
jgi:hypothetical protein